MSFKEIVSKIGLYLIVVGVVFGFLTICNWGVNPNDWNGFSRVLLAIFGVTTIKVFWD